MAINLAKSINLLKKSSSSVKSKAGSAKSNVELNHKELEQATKDIEQLTKELDTECEQTQQPVKPKKERKPNGKGTKKVQVRPPRSYKPRDLKRIARKVMDDNGDCPSGQALIAAAVLSETNAEHWIDIIIRMLGTIHDIYQILYDASDYGAYISDIRSLQGSEWWIISDIIDYLLDFVIFLLSLPRELVLLLKPIDDFILALKAFLIRFRSLIISMV